MRPFFITARNREGLKFYAAVVASESASEKWTCPMVARNRDIAAMWPFPSVDAATDELIRVTGCAEPTGYEQ